MVTPKEKADKVIADILPRDFLTKLPFENQATKVISRVNEAVRESSIVKTAQGLYDRMPKLPEVPIPTPLGELTLPNINPLPEPTLPQIDARRMEIIKASIGIDAASLLTKIASVIPGGAAVAGFLEEELADLYTARMRQVMTPQEYKLFIKYDKLNPLDVMAAVRALLAAERKRY